MRAMVAAVMLGLAGAALAGEGEAPEQEAAGALREPEEAAAVGSGVDPGANGAAAEPGPVPATAPAAEDDLAPVRLADLQLALARKTSPRVKLDLYAPPSPPLVVADGCGLLVQRRFGR